MCSIFDGMGAALTGVFGDEITVDPGGAGPIQVEGRIRDEVVEIVSADGEPYVGRRPMLRLTIDQAVLAEGDLVIGADGRRYVVATPVPVTSPASDALAQYTLRKEP